MTKNNQICFRCSGRKKIFKIGGGYTLINMGGQPVDCPLCLGKGVIDKEEKIKILQDNIGNEIKNSLNENKNKIKNKSRGRPKKLNEVIEEITDAG